MSLLCKKGRISLILREMVIMKRIEEVVEIAKSRPRRKMAVSAPEGLNVIEGLKMAFDLVEPILVGDRDRLIPLMEQVGLEAEIVDVKDPVRAAHEAVKLVSSGNADLIMKGKTDTPNFLRAVLNREYGLRTGRLLSHVTIMEIPEYHKLLFVTDAGMNIRPDYAQKVEIVKNAVNVLNALGYSEIKIAVVASIEALHHEMPETYDAAMLSKAAQRGQLGEGVLLEGPLGFDIAISKKSAEIKKINSPVAGDADVILVPDVASGNIMAKAIIYFGRAKSGGIVVGAKAPVVLLSRADTPEQKYYSIAFALATIV